jgi:hypothetical protein
MQSDGVDIPSAGDIAEELWDQFEEQVEEGLDEIVQSGIELVFGTLQTEITDWLGDLFELFFGPMVGTPAPAGPPSPAPVDIAFSEAQGWWSPLISNVYFDAIVPLALGIQFIAWAIVGVRYKAINPVVRKKLARRLLVAFLALFFWLPIASLSTQFFDALGRQIVLTGFDTDTAATVGDLVGITASLTSATFGAFVILFVVAAYVYLKALFVFVARWLMVVLLTIAMPLVASFWALEVWPFNRFAGLSKQIAGAYPGLLAAGLPAAVLLRIGLEAGGEASSVSFGLGSSLAFVISLVIVYLAAKAQKIMIRRSSRVSMQVSEQVLGGAKKPAKIGAATGAGLLTLGAGAVGGTGAVTATAGGLSTASSAAQGRVGRTAYSARMVHRGLANKPPSGESSNSKGDNTESRGIPQKQRPHTDITPDGGGSGGGTNPVPDRQTVVDSQNQSTTVGPRGRATKVGANRAGQSTTVDTGPRRRETKVGAADDETVTYWDAIGGDYDHSETQVYTTDEQPSDSLGSTSDDSLEDVFENGGESDTDPMTAAPAASSDGDPPDEAGAGQVDPAFEDIFAGGDDPLGPAYYR